MFNSVYLTALMLEKCWKEAIEQEESREKHWKKEKSECNKKQRGKKKNTEPRQIWIFNAPWKPTVVVLLLCLCQFNVFSSLVFLCFS